MSTKVQNKPLVPVKSEIGEKVQSSEYPRDNGVHRLVNEQAAKDARGLLVVLRCVNAALIWTFFQPDEYFQSLEPAWQMAFGSRSGAWMTWEWKHQLRSSLHPALFAIVYVAAELPMRFMGMFPQFQAIVLDILPNIVQAFLAATTDYYTWQLSERIYGTGSNASWATLMITVFSPWNWFCSTRTFSNGLETTLTIVALYYWPWGLTSSSTLSIGSDLSQAVDEDEPAPAKDSKLGVFGYARSINHLRISLLLAAAACILRPTNLLIWFCIIMTTILGMPTNTRASIQDYVVLVQQAILCGAAALTVSAISDYVYFDEWTLPPYQFLNFNISQNLAIFYGQNDWHYYLSQGLPLLLTTGLPFTLIAIYKATSLPATNIRFILSTIVLFTVTTLSLVSHKEVRFIYPLLPLLHILTGPPLASYFMHTTHEPAPSKSSNRLPTSTTTILHKPLLTILITLNLLIAGYTTIIHQRGVITVTKFLRQEYETLALDGRGLPLSSPQAGIHDPVLKLTDFDPNETFVAFLMPCHSTPWRSKLFYKDLHAWALTCEPPIHLAANTQARKEYRDEADRFYDDPIKFLKEEVGKTRERAWPRYVVGFEGIEGVLKSYYEGVWGESKVVRERWRGFNSHWIDDERRKGDVVVWEFVDREAS